MKPFKMKNYKFKATFTQNWRQRMNGVGETIIILSTIQCSAAICNPLQAVSEFTMKF